MWENINLIIIVAEIVLLAVYVIISHLKTKKTVEALVFMGIVFVLNYVLYMVPYLYGTKLSGAAVFDGMGFVSDTLKLFVGEIRTDGLNEYSEVFPVYKWLFAGGAALALLASVSTAATVFNCKIKNYFRLTKAMRARWCDIVKGSSATALGYAKANENVVILLDESTDKELAVSLMKDGYTVLRRKFSPELLGSRLLNKKTRYNIICPDINEMFLDEINTFVSYKKQSPENKCIYLYVEVDESRREIVQEEIIEKIGYREFITTFSRDELLAREFTEKYPITTFLPEDFIMEDTSVNPDSHIKVFMLGFGGLSREMYKRSVMNNQLAVVRDGKYHAFPIEYSIYDTKADPKDWITGGLEAALGELDKTEYFELPDIPCKTTCINAELCTRETVAEVSMAVNSDNTFSYVIIDTGDVYKNIELGAKLTAKLEPDSKYHIFIRCETPVTQEDENITYYGDFSAVFTHDIIVNESLVIFAKKLNAHYENIPENATPEEASRVSEKSWKTLNYFTMYSNIYLAANMRLKLHLLGLDYTETKPTGETMALSDKYPCEKEEHTHDEYTTQGVRNALLAQEHFRWNAYHLFEEYLPNKKSDIYISNMEKPKFAVKNPITKKHACLTTFDGLRELSAYLAAEAEKAKGQKYAPEQFDYFEGDALLFEIAQDYIDEMGYSIIAK